MQNAEKHMVPLAEHQKVVQEMEALKQRLAWMERMMFGKKSERLRYLSGAHFPVELSSNGRNKPPDPGRR